MNGLAWSTQIRKRWRPGTWNQKFKKRKPSGAKLLHRLIVHPIWRVDWLQVEDRTPGTNLMSSQRLGRCLQRSGPVLAQLWLDPCTPKIKRRIASPHPKESRWLLEERVVWKLKGKVRRPWIYNAPPKIHPWATNYRLNLTLTRWTKTITISSSPIY